jgi:hypothetical protein
MTRKYKSRLTVKTRDGEKIVGLWEDRTEEELAKIKELLQDLSNLSFLSIEGENIIDFSKVFVSRRYTFHPDDISYVLVDVKED